MVAIGAEPFFRDAYAYARAYGLDDPEASDLAHKMAADARRMGHIEFDSFDREIRRRIYKEKRLARIRASARESDRIL
jgi:hypothetical protein